MDIPKGGTVAVADGERLNLLRNSGDEANPKLTALEAEDVSNENKGSGARHQSSSANPDSSQIEEDSFASGTAELLNRQVLGGQIANLIIIAAPRTLGELRKHYHQKLSAALIGEIPKDLTGHSAQEIEKQLPAHRRMSGTTKDLHRA
ncbi:host attachment protein [Mesorhizobium sp. INR15]|uniref:host attachment family protein n=1 Tax=Mesorhizobium sp. INR15 TaxID=2654248 RepID=UPI0018964EDA|nr:host attachment protein [Mesorhizobium sp. INR15]QPC95915.1 host cell attachment protein [Mesorhizobium sp. INR15]